ncbi:AMP-binding protein [Mobilicoccus sp.]|uniref:AMP-binding protein n=1 Tax=Mobilicoccus sp. TaxID=2034349 RepID=UPI0028AD9C4F|nr:AMP-binding protein [Mobilicoccus sp.]
MRSAQVQTWPAPGGTWAQAVASWPVVESALRGDGPAVCPDPSHLPECEIPDDVALLLGTSGSTGTPKYAQLTADSLRASVDGVHRAMGGPGAWLLCVPPTHITGFQGIQRSFAAGHEPVCLDPGPFTPAAFVAGVARLPDAPGRYTTLVPTQLVRILADPVATEAARSLTRVLVGGAPLPGPTAERARRAGLRVTLGYGASETSGGCLYDGRFLDCAHGRLADGRILVGGRVVASGYAGRPDLTAAAVPVRDDGSRWFRTDDAGEFTDDGRLLVLGRLDDVINTGGLKVAPRVVEEAIAHACPEVQDVLVVGLPDPEWGDIVAAAIVVDEGSQPAPSCAEIRARLDLPGYARPRFVLPVAALPLTGPGKHDRIAARAMVQAARAG